MAPFHNDLIASRTKSRFGDFLLFDLPSALVLGCACLPSQYSKSSSLTSICVHSSSPQSTWSQPLRSRSLSFHSLRSTGSGSSSPRTPRKSPGFVGDPSGDQAALARLRIDRTSPLAQSSRKVFCVRPLLQPNWRVVLYVAYSKEIHSSPCHS